MMIIYRKYVGCEFIISTTTTVAIQFSLRFFTAKFLTDLYLSTHLDIKVDNQVTLVKVKANKSSHQRQIKTKFQLPSH